MDLLALTLPFDTRRDTGYTDFVRETKVARITEARNWKVLVLAAGHRNLPISRLHQHSATCIINKNLNERIIAENFNRVLY